MTQFEKKLRNEELDTAEVVRGLLKAQATYAAAQDRPLGRGTHTKGICVRAVVEIYNFGADHDPQAALRLSHGLFAHPGTYQATVRFANAASQIYADSAADVRAMSFSVDLPPGIAPGIARQDFSLQDATTFPINNLHDFAVLMRVMSASGGIGKLRALCGLSILEFLSFAKTAVLGKRQEHPGTKPYQSMRYWSTVPFTHGPDEAVKFTAIPDADNPAHDVGTSVDALQEELVRHLNQDERMSSFAIGIQLLEPERMKLLGMRRKASFWIENASAEWKESQSRFYVVGRITLQPKSVLSREECQAQFIDVTENTTPDTKPIGSINRGRREAELASRKVRSGEVTAGSIVSQLPESPKPSRLWLAGKAALAGALLVVVLYWMAGLIYPHLAARNLPPPEHADRVVYLNQGWGQYATSKDRETFYYTPQGTQMHGIRYSWFVNLERPFSKTRFADPQHLRDLNFIVDASATPANPDDLPVGFAKHFDNHIDDYVVDITCAACHTGQLYFKKGGVTTAVRIDGGEAMTAFTDTNLGSFQKELGFSMIDTLVNPFKFNRFADGVLGNNDDTLKAKWILWQNMRSVTGGLLKIMSGSSNPHLYPVQEGYGRTDALARIGNVVFGDHISSKNYKVGDAPVSYPYLWNIWKFDWEQYNASVSQPMARNVGEALGVGATFRLLDDYGRPLPRDERYQTSVNFKNLLLIESTLQKLQPPKWPEEVFGKIDQDRARRGEVLFNQLCAKCHGPYVASDALKKATSPGRTSDDPMWKISPINVKIIGTDPTAADNFYRNTVDLAPAGITREDATSLLREEFKTEQDRMSGLAQALQQEKARRMAANPNDPMIKEIDYELKSTEPITDDQINDTLNQMDPRDINAGRALNILGLLIRQRYYKEQNITGDVRSCYAGFGTLDLPQVVDGYKPRPLAGVWATAPFLHNGSVPNLYELLSPVSERSKRFYVGSRNFDPQKVGFDTTPPEGSSGGFWFDTSLTGNHNTGHEFSSKYDPSGPRNGVIGPALTPEQRYDIIEYLKIRQDNAPPTKPFQPVDCAAMLNQAQSLSRTYQQAATPNTK